MSIHTVTITGNDGSDHLFASPDGKTYLEVRDLTGVTAEGLRDVMDHGRRDPETGHGFLPMSFDRRFFSQAKMSDWVKAVTYTDPIEESA